MDRVVNWEYFFLLRTDDVFTKKLFFFLHASDSHTHEKKCTEGCIAVELPF